MATVIEETSTAVILRGDARNLALADSTVDLIVTSPPYFALRSYTDGGEHYDGQLGSEPTPKQFVASLVDCTREWMRVLKPAGSMFVNLGDKYAGSGGHNNSAISAKSTLRGNGHVGGGPKIKATRRSAPDRYNQSSDGIRPKSLMGLPWRYALECVDTLGLILRAEIIWQKPNGLPESVCDRVVRKHEQWFHFVKEGSYFADIDEIRDPYAPATGERYATHGLRSALGNLDHPSKAGKLRDDGDVDGWRGNPKGKLPGSVWSIASEPFKAPPELGVDHFAAFPSEWPKRIIQAWSPPGGIVLDPFGGTGTTALAADALGRIGITNDMSSDYCRLAKWRTSDPKCRERMRRRIYKQTTFKL